MAEYFTIGDVVEVLNDYMIYASAFTGESPPFTRIIHAKEGDLIQYLGPKYRAFGRTPIHHFIYMKCDEDGNVTGFEVNFYVKNMVAMLKGIGYEVEA